MDIFELIGFILLLIVILYSTANRTRSPPEELKEKTDKEREEGKKEPEYVLENKVPLVLALPKASQRRSSSIKKQIKPSLPLSLKKTPSTSSIPPNRLLESLVHRRQGNHGMPTRIEKKIARLPHLQDLMIYQEIISRPKSLREE